MAVWAICKIQSKSWQWTTATFCAVLFMLVLILIAVTFAMPRFKQIQTLTDNLNRVTRENLTGLRVVRAYNAEDYQEKKFQAANDELTSNNLTANRIMAIMFPGIESGHERPVALAVYLDRRLPHRSHSPHRRAGHRPTGGPLLRHGRLLFLRHAGGRRFYDAGHDLYHMAPGVRVRKAGAGGSGNPLLHHRRQAAGRPARAGGRSGIPGRDLPLSRRQRQHPGACAASSARKGQTVAFIGATGSGKTSLVNLIPRFYDVTGGQVLVDGVDVRDYALDALHEKLGYVPQKAVMFSGTVWSNVTYGAEHAAQEQVQQAVAIAQATDFVDTIGYDGAVAQEAPTSPADKSSGWPSPGPYAGNRKSIFSTTASPLWTIGPTGSCARP